MKYLVDLGSDLELSLAELITVYPNLEIEVVGKNYVIAEAENWDYKEAIHRLAGTRRIGELIFEGKNFEEFSLSEKIDFNKVPNKINYSINNFNLNNENVKKFRKKVLKEIKNQGIKAFLKKPSHKKENILSPSDFYKKNVDIELNLIKSKKMCVFLTKCVFNHGMYEKRDKEMPVKRYSQAISIRLARIMINLSSAKKEETLLDPFCGVGTILTEAVLMGLKVIGTDISFDCVRDSRKNLEHITNKDRKKFNIIRSDAKAIAQTFYENKLNKVAAVVSEPYMGPLIKEPLTFKEIMEIKKKLELLYKEFFFSANKILKQYGRIVFITPVFIAQNKKKFHINMYSIIKDVDLKIVNPLFGIIKNFEMPFYYKRPDHKIGREIWVLQKFK